MRHGPVALLISMALLIAACNKPSSSGHGQGDSSAVTQSDDYYTCPMHPQVHQDKPGVCPICGMDLVKASNSTNMEMIGTEAMVPLNDRDQLLANVATMKVAYEEIEHAVHAYGNLAIADPAKAVISARSGGRIEKLYVDAVGVRVKAGDPLFDFYSPDIVQASNEYIQTIATNVGGQTTIDLMKSKLALLGLTEKQISALESSGIAPLVTTYHSPASGTIIDKRIVRGSYVSEGTTLYEIADMRTLWNIADVYETDAGHIAVGEPATLTTAAYPDRSFKAKVALIYPVVDPQVRTVKVRLVVDNTAGLLRPNMYTETVFKRTLGRSITVPVNAVLITGKRNLVYVRADHENHFQAREVGLGSRFDGKYEITYGLRAGDDVVAEGGYLIDSESQLKSGNGATHEHAAPGMAEPTSDHGQQHSH
jgi:membrane fusion protein, copper/silver efflux system